MQGPQDNFFFHPNQRFGGDGGLEDERQLLVEEQKFCRARARKFSLETKRRRKALEERQKQWDVQEQRLRENILQQRRQQVQDATERFQRAHLPPSQRRRQFFRRNVPNIDDALNQLQGSMSSFTRQSSVLCSTSDISRSCTPSPKPPTVSKPSHHQGLSAVEAYTKLLQEQSMTIFKNSQETEKSQEKLQDHSPQDSHLSDCCNSESLSSKDSLENEDLNHSTNNFYSSFLLDSEKPHLNLGKQNYLIPTSQLTSSGMMLLGDNLNQSQKLHELKQKKQEDYEGSNNKMYVSKGSWGFTSGQMLKTETQTTEDKSNFLSSREIIGSDFNHFEVNYSQNCVNNNIATHKVTSGTALESLCPKQEALLDPKHQRVHDDKHPSATEILFPAKNSKDILSWAPQKPNIFLNDSTTDNVSQEQTLQQTGKENSFLSSRKEPSASINNLNKVSQSESKTVKSINTAMLQHTSLSNIQSDTLKCLKCPEEDVQKFPVSEEASHPVCEVRFIKGILKKPSKYMSGDTACVYGSGQLIFAKQVALEIRDSIELTKGKAKDMEGNAIKKKLRWFDEVHVGKEDKARNTMKQMKGKFVSLSQSKKNPEDHQLSLATVSGASKPGPSMTPPATTGYHFTKQAWADVGVQVSLPQQQADEVKVPRSSTRTGGPKVPWRERSARAGAGPVSSRTRKGTVIRPQSAIEVNRIAKPQGKMMVPCPPPRIDSLDEKTAYITKTPYGMDHASVNCKQAPTTEQALHKFTSEGFFSPYTHHLIGTDSAVVYTPLPPSYTCPVSATSGHQEAPSCSRRKGMVFNEKALCLDCTPTDEEISKLWHGVRSALATKDEKNVLKRQTLESGRVFRKHCTEQSRQPSGSGNRRLPQPSQPTKQLTEPVKIFSNTCNMAFTDEALDGAARLHLAEVHTPGLLEGKDIVAAMETTQTQSPGTVQQRSKQQGLTSISLEEQKILLSLDRLNQQLRRVREHVGSNNGTPGLLLIDAPFTKEIKVTNHLKHCASSANYRSRYQKKF